MTDMTIDIADWTPKTNYAKTSTTDGTTDSVRIPRKIEDVDQQLLDYLATKEANKLLYSQKIKIIVTPLIQKKWILPRKAI